MQKHSINIIISSEISFISFVLNLFQKLQYCIRSPSFRQLQGFVFPQM